MGNAGFLSSIVGCSLSYSGSGFIHHCHLPALALRFGFVSTCDFPKIRGTSFWGPYNKHPSI